MCTTISTHQKLIVNISQSWRISGTTEETAAAALLRVKWT